MKISFNLLTILICSLFLHFACTSDITEEESIKVRLIEKLMATEEVQNLPTINNKPVVFKSKYCESNDCRPYFKHAKQPILIFSKEDLFMRDFKSYIEINEILIGNDLSQLKATIKNGKKVHFVTVTN